MSESGSESSTYILEQSIGPLGVNGFTKREEQRKGGVGVGDIVLVNLGDDLLGDDLGDLMGVEVVVNL